MNCESKAFALCATATNLLTRGRGSQRYESKSPIGSSQNECFLLPQRSQSSSMSADISHFVQKSFKRTRLGTCSVAESETFVSWVVSKSKQITLYRCEAIRSLTSPCNRCPISTFCLQLTQYGFLHSCFLFVSKLPHATKFFFCSHSFLSTYSYACRNTPYSWKFYCTTRTGFEHGKTRIERQTYNYYTPVRIYVTSLRHPLLHALHKYRFAIARVIFTITW